MEREIGEHDQRLKTLEREMGEVRDELKDANAKLAVISATLSEARGGWKLMMAIGGFASLVTMLVAKFTSFFSGG